MKEKNSACWALLASSAWLPVLGINLKWTTTENLTVSYLGLHSFWLQENAEQNAGKAGKAKPSMKVVHMNGVT